MRQQLAAGVGRAAIATLPLLLAFVTLALAPRGAAAQQRSDAELLLAFKLALGVENEVLDSWQGTEACGGTWTGVVCENARVIGIDLNDKSLRGYLPVTLVLPDTLQRLNMGGNKLRGPLPETFHMPAALRDIQLCCNSLAGPLPAGWVPSPHLDTLSLDHNKLDGTLPANWKLPENFRLLNLHENKFMGTLPTWAGSKASVAVTPGNTGLCGDVRPEGGRGAAWRRVRDGARARGCGALGLWLACACAHRLR
ncbi:MAG: hypothetical protein J3K34DRAFT_435040 [Monoraphidium minutum]|nr:MAG: hypothetical protein J3K34DRAFT_435040 [Monoraphidium minutum]